MGGRLALMGAACLGLAFPLGGAATATEPDPPPGEHTSGLVGTGFGIGLTLGGGVTGFVDEIAGLDSHAILLGSGAEDDLRVQGVTGVVRPYAFGGVGWTLHELTRSPGGGNGMQNDDNVGTIPLGLGVCLGGHGVLVDLRGTGRYVFDAKMLDAAFAGRGKSAQLHNWAVTARLGAEF